MAPNTLLKTNLNIAELISAGCLFEAIKNLESLDVSKQNIYLLDLLKKQKETYRYMIHYFVEGFGDKSRERVLSDIKNNLYFINDYVLRESIVSDSSDIYSSTLRYERHQGSTLSSRLDKYKNILALDSLATEANGSFEFRKQLDEALSDLFSYVWTMFGSNSSDYRQLVNVVYDNVMPFEIKSQIISALLLGNLRYFDRKGFETLLDIYDADISSKLSARALTAVVMIIAEYPKRILSDIGLIERLSVMKDSIVAYRQLREIVMSLIRARDTERISNKMKNEVLPELMKLKPEILNKFRNLSENPDLNMLEENPEWEDIMSKSGLGDKLKELTEMQMDGGDVMMMAFSNLKSFPFFNNVSNWFLPFSPSHHELSDNIGDNGNDLYKLLDMEGVMCDSDKYSFALSLTKMPADQKSMMSARIQEQIDQMKEALSDKKLSSSIPEFDTEVTRYVRDLYRFFKLFRKKQDFRDPFISPLDFMDIPVICNILSDSEILNLVGTFYFKRGYYNEALPILLKLDSEADESSSGDSQAWEKIGYCYHMTGDIDNALIWYRKAELLHQDSKWLIKKIAICYRQLGNFEEASYYYSKALEFSPDNFNLLMNYGYALAETDRLMESLQSFYHADYIKPDQPQTQRAIAWVEFLNENFNRSIEIYNKLNSSPDLAPSDLINEGHAHLMLGDMKNALALYKKSIGMSGFNLAMLEKNLKDDSESIEHLKKHKQEIRLLIDRIRFDSE